VLSEVTGGHECEDVGLQALEVWMVEGLDGRLFNRPVHSLGLTIRPWVIRLGQPVLDAVFGADTIEDVGTKTSPHAIARNMLILPSASHISQVSMWTQPIGVSANRPLLEAL
jgi:hypothetical protein